MTYVPQYVIIGTADDLTRVKTQWDNWCQSDITKKHGVRFLTVEEAKAENLDLSSMLVEVDKSAKPMLPQIEKAIIRPQQTRAERRAQERKNKKRRL